MLRFTIRGVLILTLIVGLLMGWLRNHRRLAAENAKLKEDIHTKLRSFVCPTSPPPAGRPANT